MVKQDSRVKADEGTILRFFEKIKYGQNDIIREMLNEFPTLVYAFNPNPPTTTDGIEVIETGLAMAVRMGTQNSLYTCEILLSRGADRLQSYEWRGSCAVTSLEAIARLLEDRSLFEKFMRLILPECKLSFDDLMAIDYAMMQSITHTVDEVTQRTNPYPSCIVSIVHDLDYNQIWTNIFSKQSSLNLEQQKKIAQESFDSLKGISFASDIAPKSFLASFMPLEQRSDEFSIVIIPKELMVLSIERITEYLGMLFDYFNLNASGPTDQ